MKYNVGDKVRIKSLDWYNKNKNILGNIVCGDALMTFEKARFCGKIITISSISDITNAYRIEEDNGLWNWTDEMIEGCVESIEDRMKELRKMCTINLTDSNYSDKVEVLLNDYEYIEEEGKSYFVKKKKEVTYPKTYEECCKIFGLNHYLGLSWNSYDEYSGVITGLPKRIDDIAKKLESLSKLLICRDAYWKIAGDWKPDYQNKEQKTFFFLFNNGNYIEKGRSEYPTNKILIFPTEEMRDAFYENFKELIEMCKELL